MPTINAVSTNAHMIYFFPKAFIKPVAIFWAAPLSATNLPNMAPSPSMMMIEPSKSPIPFCNDAVMAIISIPLNKPIKTDTIIKAIKAFNRAHVINTMSNAMPIKRISSDMMYN